MIEGHEVVASTGVIATGPAEGARAGARLFERGGNAMDAAAAACLVCAVLEPQAVDLGGYVFAAVVLDGQTGQVWSLDANSVAPAAAREDMFQTLPPRLENRGINEIEYGCSVSDDANIYGPLSVAVPGLLAGVGTLSERWGHLKWSDIVRPARDFLEGGLRYSLVRDAIIKKREAIQRFPTTAAILMPDGCVPDYDAPWHRRDLASTFHRVETHGWRDFYDGQIGRAIAAFVQCQGGILTAEDMAAFLPRVTEPCSGSYGNAEVHTAIAPNGGFSVLAALAELDRANLGPDGHADYWGQLAGVLRHMWTRRLHGVRSGATPHGTVHVAAADKKGNLVSATISQGGLFGSCLAVPGTGIILGHGMCRFDPHSGFDNSPGPRKRPLNNVCPLIVRTPDRDVAIGARGGRRIVSVMPQLVQRIVDQNCTAYTAAVAPRMHTITGHPLDISANFDPGIRQSLGALGHHIEIPDEVAGAAHGAEILKASGQLRAGGNTWAAGI